jgi:hypothetical protein
MQKGTAMATRSDVDVQATTDLQPGSYVGLYVGDRLMYTGILKDIGQMQSGKTVCQVLLVKNIFQRNLPEIHIDPDIRPATLEQIKAEVKQLKINLQKHLAKLETDTNELIKEANLRNILG